MKRADFKMLRGIIVVLLIFVVLLLFAKSLNELITAKTDREVCRASVLAQSTVLILPEGENIVSPDCKTFHVKFFDNHVEINGKTIKVYDSRKKDVIKKFNGLTDEIVNQVIAEELRWCWYQFLEGKRILFGVAALFPLSSERACFLCSEITFDNSVKADSFTGFYDYTKEKTIPDSDMTYYEYYAEGFRRYSQYYDQNYYKNAWEEYADGMQEIIKLVDTRKCKDDLFYLVLFENRDPINREIVFDTTLGKKYVVFLVREGKSTKPREVQKIVNQVKEGCAPETYFAYVLPFKDLSEQCSSLRRGPLK